MSTKKEKKNGAVATVAAAVVAAMVRTMDGIEVLVEKALTLSRGALVAYKRAAGEQRRSPMVMRLSGIIDNYDAKGPDVFVFASEEDPMAKILKDVVQTIKVEGEVKLFVPLVEERARRDAYLKAKSEKTEAEKRAADKQVKDAQAMVEEVAKKRGEAHAKKMAAEERAVSALAGFVDQSVVETKHNERKTRENERATKRAMREQRVTPFARGEATVVLDGGRPTHLRAVLNNGSIWTVPVVTFKGIQVDAENSGVSLDVKDIPVTCPFCEEKAHLGDMHPPRKDGNKSLPAVWQAAIEARTPDGRDVWSFRGGERDGQPRHQNVMCCCWCSSAIRHAGPRREIDDKDHPGKKWLVPAIYTKPLFALYKAWTEGKGGHWTGQTDGVATKVKGTDGVEVETETPVMAKGLAKSLTMRPFNPENLTAATAAISAGKKTPEELANEAVDAEQKTE